MAVSSARDRIPSLFFHEALSGHHRVHRATRMAKKETETERERERTEQNLARDSMGDTDFRERLKMKKRFMQLSSVGGRSILSRARLALNHRLPTDEYSRSEDIQERVLLEEQEAG